MPCVNVTVQAPASGGGGGDGTDGGDGTNGGDDGTDSDDGEWEGGAELPLGLTRNQAIAGAAGIAGVVILATQSGDGGGRRPSTPYRRPIRGSGTSFLGGRSQNRQGGGN